MPFKQKTIVIPFADVAGKGGLTKFIDIDDGTREVPVNMMFESEGFLIKDTGVDNFADLGVALIRRLWNFKQKNGTSHFLKLEGQKLRKYDSATGTYVAMQTESAALTGTVATIAPGAGTGTLTSSGTAVTGVGTNFTGQLTANVSYITVGGFVRLVTAIADNTNLTIASAFDTDVTTASSFTFGSHIVTGTGTAFTTDLVAGQIVRLGTTQVVYVLSITDATHIVVSANPTATASGLSYYKNSEYLFDASAKVAFKEYNNVLYFGNGVDPFATYNGTLITFYPALPRGNVYEAYKDRIFVSGTVREPLSCYYSNAGAPTTFSGTSVFQPIGTDRITGLISYYDTLIVLKRNSIWKVAFVYDPLAVAYLLELDIVNNNYGCSSIDAYCWVENDVWFFTGTEVRGLGFKDQQFGVLGVNDSVLSENIKETLKLLNQDRLDDVKVFYSNRRFYLSVSASTSAFNNVIFVCHLLYGKNWTKIKSRIKSSVSDFVVVDGIIYSASADVAGRIYRWSNSFNDAGSGYECYTIFRRYEDKDFSQRKVWRYIDLQFKNLEASCIVTVYADDFDIRTSKGKTFYVGTQVENQENSLGEVDWGEQLWGDAFGEDVATASFINRRLSFLSKSQAIQMKVANSTANESFSLVQYLLEGHIQPRRQFASNKITTLN